MAALNFQTEIIRRQRERLIEVHLPLVRMVACQYAHRGEQLDDLVQVGAVGLIKAVDRFDPSRGVGFAAFAVPTIRGEIQNHLRDRAGVVRVPRRLQELNGRLERARGPLADRLARPPTPRELAAEAGVAPAEADDAVRSLSARAPAPLGADAEGVLPFVEDAYETAENRALLAECFRVLGERERRILHLRFYCGLSQSEIARELQVSQIQVSRLIRRSLERLRAELARQPRRRASEPKVLSG